jgi:hypothetical protein
MPETPEPTLDDLLAACDLAEEAGVPPAVVEMLREIAVSYIVERPRTIAEIERLRDENDRWHRIVTRAIADGWDPHIEVGPREIPVARTHPLARELVGHNPDYGPPDHHPDDRIRLAVDTEDIRWEYVSRR